MAWNVYPVDAVSGAPEYTGREARQVGSAMVGGATSARPLGGRSGVRHNTPTTTVAVSGGDWTVGPHVGVLDVQTADEASVYFYANDATTTPSAIDAADATYARKDIVYVKLDDPAESDGSSIPAVTPLYLAGIPSASPAAPADPARSLVLAVINVPVSGGGSPTVTPVWPYATAAGGIIPVRNNTERDTLLTLATAENPVYVDVAGSLWTSNDGSTWRVPSCGPWVTITTDAGAPLAASNTMRYRLENNGTQVHVTGVRVQFSSGVPVTAGTEYNIVSGANVLPSGARPAVIRYGSGNFYSATTPLHVRVALNTDGSITWRPSASVTATLVEFPDTIWQLT